MKIQAEIVAVGKDAINIDEPMVILFNEQATMALKEVALIQKITSPAAEATFALTTASHLQIDQRDYQVQYVGALANENLTSIGHVALIFDQVPATNQLQGGVYLKAVDGQQPAIPMFKVGTRIIYQVN